MSIFVQQLFLSKFDVEKLAAVFGKTKPQPTSEPMYCPPPETGSLQVQRKPSCILRNLHFLHLSHFEEGSATLAAQHQSQAKELLH